MKKTICKKALGLFLTAAMVVGMAACGGSTTNTSSADTSLDSTANTSAATEAAATSEAAVNDAVESAESSGAKVETIALILPGVITDQSWSQLAYEALEDLKNEGYSTAYTESVSAADAETTFRTYADQGYDLIIGHGSEFTEAAVTVAGDYPETYFFCTNKCPDGVTPPSNLGFCYCKEYEAAYACGVAAALMTESKTVGYLGGMEQSSQIADKNAFIDGVASIDSDIQVITVMSGSFDDSALGKEAALSMIEQGADVLMHSCDTTGLGLIEACKENNVKFIGYGADQKDLEPSLAITSCIADTGMAIESVIGKVGTDEFGSSWMPGMADGVVFIGSFGDNVPQDVQDQVNQVVEQIKNGELVVENKDSE